MGHGNNDTLYMPPKQEEQTILNATLNQEMQPEQQQTTLNATISQEFLSQQPTIFAQQQAPQREELLQKNASQYDAVVAKTEQYVTEKREKKQLESLGEQEREGKEQTDKLQPSGLHSQETSKQQPKQFRMFKQVKRVKPVLSPQAQLEAEIAELKKWQEQTLVSLELLEEEEDRAKRIAESLRDDLVEQIDEKTGRKLTAKELDKIEKRLQDIEDGYEAREVTRQAQHRYLLNYQEKLDKLQQQLDALRKPAEQQPKEQVEQPKQVETVAVKEQVKQIETVVVEKQDEKQVEQTKQIVISIQEQGLQNVNAVQKLVQEEIKLLTLDEKKKGLSQIINVDPYNDAAVQKLVEQGLIQNAFLFHVLKTAFDDIDTLAADKMDLKSLGEQFYDGLSPDMYYYVDEYIAMKEAKQVQPAKQKEEDDDETDSTDTMNERELNNLFKSRDELRELVDINTDYVSAQALPLAKAYLNASAKFSSAVVVKANKKDMLSSEAKKTWNALEYRYYNMAAKTMVAKEAEKTQRQKDYEKAYQARQAKLDDLLDINNEELLDDNSKNEELLDDNSKAENWMFGDISHNVATDVDDVLLDLEENEQIENAIGFEQIGDKDVLADIEAGEFERDATKTREVKVTQQFADGFGDIEAIEQTEKTGLTKDEAVQHRLSSSYVEAAMRMDVWLKGSDAQNLMSDSAEVRQKVLDSLITQALQYKLDGKMFGEKSFVKNGEKIIEMALFFPGLMELVGQENARSSYNADGKASVLYAMNDASQELYKGYSEYAKLNGLQLGDITQSEVKVENVYEAKGVLHDSDLHKSAEEVDEATEKEKFVSKETLLELAEVSTDSILKNAPQKRLDAQSASQLVDSRISYDERLETMRASEQQYRENKKNGIEDAGQIQRAVVQSEQVEQAQQKVQERMEAIKQQGGLQQEQSTDVYSQVEQEVRQDVVAKTQQSQLEHKLDMTKFDKKMAAPPSAKELKEQEKQRKKALRRTGSSMGVTHRTGALLASIEKVQLEGISPTNEGTAHSTYRYLFEQRRARVNLGHDAAINKASRLRAEAVASTSKWKGKVLHYRANFNEDLADYMKTTTRNAPIPSKMPLQGMFNQNRTIETTYSEIRNWTSARQRKKLATLSPEVEQDKDAAQKVLTDVVDSATSSLKLKASSFSASFFTANAQQIMESRDGLRRLEFLMGSYGLQNTPSGQKLRSYMAKFFPLFDGFECFLKNNGIDLLGESAFDEKNYANVEEYRKAYKTQVAKNTDGLQQCYNDYCKALQGNA